MKKTIQLFDTTLRDGEQTPGVNFSLAEKVEIAQQLERWGVDAIEAGFPAASPGDFEAVRKIGQTLKKTTVVGLARCHRADIDQAYAALKDAANPQIHVFLATSPIHMRDKLKMSESQVLATIAREVAYARDHFTKVQFSPEDATRSEPAFLVQAIRTAIAAGATIINIPDTVGYTNPTEFGSLFRYLRAAIPEFDQLTFSAHCHDDLGMAVANSLAAVENGATRIEGTLNGIGERAGNTALEEVAVALHIRQDIYPYQTRVTLAETKATSQLVSTLSEMAVPRNKAIIGANAYAHESGIHQDGVLKNPETYEIITPQLVGVERNALPLGKLSGKHALRNKLSSYEIFPSSELLTKIFHQFKQLADRQKRVSDQEILALVKNLEQEESMSL